MYFEITDENLKFLIKKDKRLGFYIKKYGNLSFTNETDLFTDIVRNIISQMLSLKAANTIFTRFIKIVSECTPENVLNISEEKLRECGISYSKIKYIKSIAYNILDKQLSLLNMENYDEETIIKQLMKQKGIGKWTAEMIALFSLGKKNIFSYDDIALRNGIKYVHPEINPDNKVEFNKLRELYSPICSIASLYYYHIHDNE